MSNKLFSIIDTILPDLRELEAKDPRIHFIRHQLESAQEDFIKQGNRIELTRKLNYICPECHAVQPDSEVMYLHLRKKHQYKDAMANEFVATLESTYYKDVNLLKQLLRKYTGSLLSDND